MSTSGVSIAALASASAASFPGSPMWLGIQQIVTVISHVPDVVDQLQDLDEEARAYQLISRDWMAWMAPRESLKTTDRMGVCCP